MRQHTRLLINGKAYQTKVKYKLIFFPKEKIPLKKSENMFWESISFLGLRQKRRVLPRWCLVLFNINCLQIHFLLNTYLCCSTSCRKVKKTIKTSIILWWSFQFYLTLKPYKNRRWKFFVIKSTCFCYIQMDQERKAARRRQVGLKVV